MKFVATLCCIVFILSATVSYGQQNIIIQRSTTSGSKSEEQFFKSLNKKYQVKDSLEVHEIAAQIQKKAINSGFPETSYHITKKDSVTTEIFIELGKYYQWLNLRVNARYKDIFYKAGYRTFDYDSKPFKYAKIVQLFEKTIQICENTGYPFAQVRLDSIEINENKVAAYLLLEPKQFIKIDSIIIKGKSKIAPYFLQQYMGLKPAQPYQENKIKAINNRLKELPYLKIIKPFEFTFTATHNKLVLYLDPKKANQFDGVLGFLPSEKNGKIEFTGQAHMMLQNALNHGELIDVEWRKLQLQSQDIKAKAVYPYVLRTPLGLDLGFKLFQRDTLFIDVNQNVGVQYLIKGQNYLKAFVNKRNVSLVSTNGLEQLTSLPDYADVKTISYGLGIRIEHTDYKFNPRRGIRTNANLSTGTKNIKKNAKIKPYLYDKIQLRSPVYHTDWSGEAFIPLFKRSTLNIATKTAAMYTLNMFTNEAFRIGGNNTLRGFDEESIYATAYTIGNLEYRYLFEQNSFLFAFFNAAWYELNTQSNYVHDLPYGFGTGISFQTKAGIFSISYALGKQFNNPIMLRAAKVHFGIVSQF